MHEASHKVPGGKFVRVRFTLVGTRVVQPQISGDFFLMPPEKLPALEQFLAGWDLSLPPDALARRIEKFLQREDILLSGIDATVLSHLIAEAGRA